MRFALSLILAYGLLLASPRELLAEGPHNELKGFWSNGDARNWEQAVSPNSSQAVSYRNYPVVVDQVKDRAKADAENAKLLREKLATESLKSQNSPENLQLLPNVSQPEKQQGQTPPPLASTPLSREQILAKFGSPDEPQIIRAQKDSPPAMQGLFEALNSGDKELAWQYAVALARRQVEMQNVVSKATDYQTLAMEAIGVRPASPQAAEEQQVDSVRQEVRELMAQTRQAELGRKVSLDPRLGEELPIQEFSGQAAKANVQPPQIPVDPEGKVKVLIFLDEKSVQSKELSEAIRPLTAMVKADPKLSILGLTRRTYQPAGLRLRGAELSFPFPLLSGEALALDLRIQSYPTFVFVAATSRETYRVEGIPALEAIEKTVKVMRGGR